MVTAARSRKEALVVWEEWSQLVEMLMVPQAATMEPCRLEAQATACLRMQEPQMEPKLI